MDQVQFIKTLSQFTLEYIENELGTQNIKYSSNLESFLEEVPGFKEFNLPAPNRQQPGLGSKSCRTAAPGYLPSQPAARFPCSPG